MVSSNLAQLIELMTPQEQAEVENFAAFVLVRRKLPTLQILEDDISSWELTRLAMEGGAFDWLADEPDIYSIEDGDEVVLN